MFFTTAAFVQLRLTGRWQPGGWRSAGWSDWWAAAVQFVGTLFFNVSTFSALIGGDHVWRPDAIGSVAFLVASLLAVHAVTIRDRLWDPTVRNWQIAWVNLAGSIAFGISAIGAYTAPGNDQPENIAIANLGTFIGALGFLAGALMMTPDPESAPSIKLPDDGRAVAPPATLHPSWLGAAGRGGSPRMSPRPQAVVALAE